MVRRGRLRAPFSVVQKLQACTQSNKASQANQAEYAMRTEPCDYLLQWTSDLDDIIADRLEQTG